MSSPGLKWYSSALRVPAPRAIRIVAWALIVDAGFGVLGFGIRIWGGLAAPSSTIPGLVGLLLGAVFWTALELSMAAWALRGRPLSRWLITLYAALALLNVASALVYGVHPLFPLVELPSTAVRVVALWALWSPASREYFRQVAERRRALAAQAEAEARAEAPAPTRAAEGE